MEAKITASIPEWRSAYRAAIVQPPSNCALAIVVALLALSAVEFAVAAEPCNPAIDGTYCATQMPARRSNDTLKSVTITPMPSLGSDLSYANDRPATFGAIVISGGRKCAGLFMREKCN